MIDGLKPYAKYKDSGVPWLGEVPEHWEVARNGRLFAERREVGFPELPVLEVSLRTGVRVRNGDSGARKQALGDLSAYKRARAGDIAYNMMRMWQGAVGVAPVDGLVSPAYVVARPFPEADSRYYESLFRTPAYMGEVNNYSRGIVPDRNRLYWDEFKDVRSPVPPHEEQLLIVRFLRALDQRIARYIRAKKKLIALMNEQKQAIIHRAVTRGLDPSVRFKASGMESLGDIPAHWRVRKLRHCGPIVGGMTPSMDIRQFWGDDIPWVTPKDMKRPLIDDTLMHVTATALQETSLRLVPAGAVLLVVRGMILARRVPVATTTRDVTINQDMKAIVPIADTDGVFLASVLASSQAALTPLIDEAGHGTRRFPVERWREVPIVMPPKSEQTKIGEYVRATAESMDNIVRAVQRQIESMSELRTCLTAKAVTGKLDIRAAAARLPVKEPTDEWAEIGDTEEETGDESEAEMEAAEIEE